MILLLLRLMYDFVRRLSLDLPLLADYFCRLPLRSRLGSF